MAVVQIAGLIARRILCDIRKAMRCIAGERFGIIRFGSRTDVYLPEGVRPLVAEGQTMIGGETVIADLAPPRGRRERRGPYPWAAGRLARPAAPVPAAHPAALPGPVLQSAGPEHPDHARPLRRADRHPRGAGCASGRRRRC